MEATVPGEVVELLRRRFGDLEHVGAGAWSVAFRTTLDDAPVVVRVGRHRDDFELDLAMADFAAPELPIPHVDELSTLDPPHEAYSICVSAFADGTPLEMVPPKQWRSLVPRIADTMAAISAITAPPDAEPWPDALLAESLSSSVGTAGRSTPCASPPACCTSPSITSCTTQRWAASQAGARSSSEPKRSISGDGRCDRPRRSLLSRADQSIGNRAKISTLASSKSSSLMRPASRFL